MVFKNNVLRRGEIKFKPRLNLEKGDKIMENIDIKKVVIAIIIVIILLVGIFFVVNSITSGNKKYTLEEISEEDYKYFSVYTDGKYGVINENGEMIIQNSYSSITIPNPTKAVFICKNENGKSEVLNDKSEKIFTEFNNVGEIETNGTNSSWPYEKSILKYEEGGKYGLIDFEGKIITKPIYEEISSVRYKEGEILAKKDGKYGVINNKGVELISFEYEEIEADRYYSDGYGKSGYIIKKRTSNGYRYGYINYKWKKLLNTEYTAISRVLDIDDKDIYLVASKGGQYGLIKNKKEVVEFAYQSVVYNKDTNLIAVQRSEQYGVLNLKGENIVPIEYRGIKFNGIYICAKGYEEDTYFDAKGEKITNGFTGMKEVADADCYITTDKNNLYGLADKNGNVIVLNSYLYIDYAFDGYFVAYKEGQGLGVIDKSNKVIVDFEYDVLSKIGDKKLLKAVKMGKEDITTIFSKDMRKIATLSDMLIVIANDYIEAYNNDEEIFISNSGELKNAKDIFTNNKLFAVNKNGKWGFETLSGEIKVEPTYDFVTEFNRFGFAGIKKDKKWGIIDDSGIIITECTFDFEDSSSAPEFLGKYYKTYKENNEIYYADINVASGEGME